jgi:hypothetical protein
MIVTGLRGLIPSLPLHIAEPRRCGLSGRGTSTVKDSRTPLGEQNHGC